MCGVYGLKPSQGRVGEVDLSVCVLGPVAATVSDLEVAYKVSAIPDPSSPIGSLFTPPKPVNNARPKILGIFDPWFQRADSKVLTRCNQVVEYMVKNLDYEVVPIEIPYLPEGQLAHALTTLAEMAKNLKSGSGPNRYWLKDVSAPTKILATVGSQTPAGDYMLAQKMRHLLMSHMASLFKKNPGLLVITPTTPMAGWPIADEGDLRYGASDANQSIRNMEYIWLSNMTGCPSITCPVGYVEPEKGTGDVPVGLLAMGEWGSEDALLEWGRDAERWLTDEYPGGRRRPAAWEDVIKNALALKAGSKVATSETSATA